MSCLVVLSGRAKGRTYQISPERDNVVGRVGECDVCIVDPRMSRRHCVISAGASGYSIRDLGSANGIVLNDVKVKEAVLKDTDKVRLGSTEMEFHLTERFEDAETKRVKPGDQQPPQLKPSTKRKSARKLDTEALVEFCSRCSGSIPATAFAVGKARKIGDECVCVECLAKDIAESEAASAASSGLDLPDTEATNSCADTREDSRERTSAEEVSQLAAEVALEAAEKEETGEQPDVPVEADDDDEFNTDALLIGEGEFDREEGDKNAGQAPEPPAHPEANEDAKPRSGYDDLPASTPQPPVPDSSAPTVLKSPEEIKRLAKDVAGAANRLEEENPYANSVLEPEDVIELDQDDLPQLPDEGQSGLDEDAKTPRPGSQIRVL